MTLLRTVVLTSLLALAACSPTRYCTKAQPYDNARSIPPIVAPEGLKIPVSSTALKVPEGKGESLTFGYVVSDPTKAGKTKAQCLDQPPRLPPLADAGK